MLVKLDLSKITS